MKRIGIDIMGGDFAPHECIKGTLLAKESLKGNAQIVLFGNKDMIISELEKNGSNDKEFEIIDCQSIVQMNDHPVKALKEKTDSSLYKGFFYLKENAIDGFASAGSTGAMLVGATQIIGITDGILRPCISSFYPNIKGGMSLILDVGLNSDCKPENLLQFAYLGNEFAKNGMCIKNPKIALLNIGYEESKGSLLAKATYDLLKEAKDINFVGNVEGYDLHDPDKVDIIVTDGFTGNIILKHAESFYTIAKEEKIDNPFFEGFNYENYGGTPILGVKNTVIIGHGKSNANAIKNMILLTGKAIDASAHNLKANIND